MERQGSIKGMGNTPQPSRSRGVKVLKAISSPLRLQILNLLFDKSALSYTELMSNLKMNPSRDAGRFAYHLKFMLKAGLVEADVEAKKYYLTDLGKMVLDVADRVEKKAVKPKGMLVRTSHLTLEEFDANKIANSLIKEAKVPAELAQKAAKEAEKRLLKSKTKYLTASLIREVVNGILIEKGFEDYRHKLTRVGMPIHEVTAAMDAKDANQSSCTILRQAGQTVLGEYTLLNVFPRDIADAHVSGAIHIDNLGTWLLKPNDVVHDMRFFFQNGLTLENQQLLSLPPPEDFEAALNLVFNVLLHSSREVNSMQIYNYFNVSLAPYAKGVDPAVIKEKLRLFVLTVNQHAQVTLGLELLMPKYVMETPFIGSDGKPCGKYGDFQEESQLIADLALQVYNEESAVKPLFNPSLVVKITKETLNQDAAKALIEKAHLLAEKYSSPFFALMLKKDFEYNVYSALGTKLTNDLTGDWETDTMRTGCLGCVTINLPRIAQESGKDKNKFFDLLRERCELAARALFIKSNILRQYGKNSLPFLLKSANGDTYFRIENCSRIINFAGLPEAVETFTEKDIHMPESQKFTEELVQTITTFKHKLGRKHGKRLYPAILFNHEASERLAQLDIEKYGVAKVKFSGTRDKPFYSTTRRLQANLAGSKLELIPEQLETEQKICGLNVGSGLSIVEIGEPQLSAQTLMDLTVHLIEKQPLEYFTYNHVTSYCSNCKKTLLGTPHKCQTCGSISTLNIFDRFNAT
ncbi:MAG: ArsR family transcriptional regulator [Candidatus Bathyarchaeota archaeon]|nr:ArsR family transcriptional regulator [Candidatus Bathyarchaeota archaeon]